MKWIFLLLATAMISCSNSNNTPQRMPHKLNKTHKQSKTQKHRKADKANYNWAQWRGPLGNGVAPYSNPPTTWSEKNNIRWKLALPGKGHSTPIVWENRVYITTAIPYGKVVVPTAGHRHGAHDNLTKIQQQKFAVLAISRDQGKIIWQQVVHKNIPHEGSHYTASFASGSPITDGKYIFAFFGSQGVYCLDIDGKLRWKRDLGDMQTKHGHGEGGSPALYGDTLVINWDHEGPSFIIALHKHTGKELWKAARNEVTSWSTPLVVQHKGKSQVIVSASRRICSYDLATGKIIWECGGLSKNVVASPVAADGMVYFGCSYDKRVMLAIRLDGAKGDITGSNHVVWTKNRHTPYVPSPLLYKNRLYFLKHYQGVLTCLTATTGKKIYGPVRLPDIYNVYASPVAAADRVYITDLNGATLVLAYDKPEALAQNKLNDSFNASPAIVGNELFLRGKEYLYCISETNK